MTGFGNRVVIILASTAAVVLPASAWAYETDQFYNRAQPIADSTEVLNKKVNDTIETIATNWRRGHDERHFVNEIYHNLGGHHWVDKLERWAMKSPDVEKLETPRYDSVYSGLPIWSTRATFFFGIGDTIRINDELMGSDKIGHFFSQGRKFYRRYLKYESEEEAAKHSAYTERAIFGHSTTGSYSNADLVANYEGYRFYRSLFDDDVIEGKAAILRWEGDHWVVQRPFDWADHVNAYWDEALNINHYDRLLYKPMRKRLVSLCPQYWEHPELYTVHDEDELKTRYPHLGLKDTSELRLDHLCPLETPEQGESALAAGEQPNSPVSD